MRKLLVKLALVLVPVALLVIAINFFVDPANMFRSRKFVSGIVDILAKGHNVNNVKNYDERLLQEQMISRLQHTPDVVVLGSSRIMEIGHDFYPGKTVLNAGVSHANVYDLLAITGLMDSLNRLPREIIINVDHFLIGKLETSDWQSILPYYHYFFRKHAAAHRQNMAEGGSNELHKYSSLLSFPYFKESLHFLFSGADKKYYDAGNARPTGAGRLYDGTVCYPDEYMYPDTAKMGVKTRDLAIREGIEEVDPGKMSSLKVLIDFLKSRNITLHLLMVPYHHDYYQLVNKYHHGALLQYEKIFRELAAEKQIPITGTFDPAPGGFGASSFYDMYHCNKETIRQIIHN